MSSLLIAWHILPAFGSGSRLRPRSGARGWLGWVLLAVAATSARAEVEIVGIEAAQLANVLAYSDLDELACDAEQRSVRTRFDAAPGQLRTAMQAYGYYDINLVRSLEFGADCWIARFEIDPGEPVRIRGLDIRVMGQAAMDPAFEAALAGHGLAVGGALEHARYDALKRRLSDLARDLGYARAEFTASRLDIYPSERAVDIVLNFYSGPRYRFGEIRVEQSTLNQDLVRSYFGFQSGDPYLNRRLSEVYIDLSDSGYFETIDVRPLPPDHEAQTIDVAVSLTPATSRLISYGVGFSSDTGPRLRFGRQNRRWNERGHQFGINAQLSPVISEFTANYRFPYGDPRREWVSFDAGVLREDTDTAQSESIKVGARRVFSLQNDWWRTLMLDFAIEDFEVGNQIGRSRLLMPGVEWRRQRADSSIRPNRGSRLSFMVRAAADDVASDTSFLQTVIEGKWIRSLWERSRVIMRGQVGILWEDSFQDLPPSVRFFTGGDHTVRGYGFETLGPRDASGEVVGGSRLLTTSIEYERLLRPKWSLAFFVDSGNAFEGTRIDAKTGVGFGARWLSPLGPIRFDIAAPLDHDRSLRIHVNLGPDL